MSKAIVIPILIILCPSIMLLAQIDQYFTTNRSNKSNGLAGVKTKLAHFNDNASYQDLLNDQLRVHFNFYDSWYTGFFISQSKFYNFSISKGIYDKSRIGIEYSYLSWDQLPSYGDDFSPGDLTSYFFSIRTVYSSLLTTNIGIGAAFQITRLNLASGVSGIENIKSPSIFSFDVGFVRYGFFKFLTVSPDISLLPSVYHLKPNTNEAGITLSANIVDMGGKIAFFDDAQADPTPQRLSLGLDYRVIDSRLIALSLIVEFEKPLTAYNYDNQEWYPFWRALYMGWSNHSSDIEKKDIITRLAIELQFMKQLVFRLGSYRHPLRGGLSWDGKYHKYEYLTWGLSLNSSPFTVSVSFLTSDLQALPWERQFAISLKL